MPVVGRARRILRWLTVRGARDATAFTAGRSALIVAPHPDDETLGCGALILRKRHNGTTVTLAVVTDGRHSHRSDSFSPGELAQLRRQELREAASRLALPEDSVRWLGIEDGTVAENEDSLVGQLVALLTELCPDELYATCADEPHPDHASVGRAARRAAHEVAGVTLLEYPIWLWNTWPLRKGDRIASTLAALTRMIPGGCWKVGTGRYVDKKLFALQAHGSQVRRPSTVPPTMEWGVLPEPMLAAASGPFELFFRTPPLAS